MCSVLWPCIKEQNDSRRSTTYIRQRLRNGICEDYTRLRRANAKMAINSERCLKVTSEGRKDGLEWDSWMKRWMAVAILVHRADVLLAPWRSRNHASTISQKGRCFNNGTETSQRSKKYTVHSSWQQRLCSSRMCIAAFYSARWMEVLRWDLSFTICRRGVICPMAAPRDYHGS